MWVREFPPLYLVRILIISPAKEWIILKKYRFAGALILAEKKQRNLDKY